ncbi:MAG: hypothetical protein ACNYZH_10455 [Acidimicrobiia bacterium]
MSTRVDLTIDKQGRMSVGKLGLSEGHAVADQLPDGSGWVVRPAVLMTEAERDVVSRAENVAAIERSLDDLRQGRVVPRTHR